MEQQKNQFNEFIESLGLALRAFIMLVSMPVIGWGIGWTLSQLFVGPDILATLAAVGLKGVTLPGLGATICMVIGIARA